jgi:hypothetical protein
LSWLKGRDSTSFPAQEKSKTESAISLSVMNEYSTTNSFAVRGFAVIFLKMKGMKANDSFERDVG